MKKLIVSFIAFVLIVHVSGAVYNIGNHEIHYDNGIYFKIYLSDTFRIDTSTFIIKYVEGTESSVITSIENTHSLVRKHEFITGFISYNYISGLGFIAMCTNLENEPNIEVLELNYEVKLTCDPITPNDVEFYQQWYLDTIKATQAWNITTGNEDVIIGIVDSGFDWEHGDLGPGNDGYENNYLNEAENDWTDQFDPCSGEKDDDDPNPDPDYIYVDDWKGFAVKVVNCPEPLNNDTREYDRDALYTYYPEPYYGDFADKLWKHGTFIAGIIGAKTNNGTDIAGIAGGWGNKGVSLLYTGASVFENFGITTESLERAIQYCILHDGYTKEVSVIQMAFETFNSTDLKLMIDEAYIFNDIFFVAAAGNKEEGGNDIVSYPARWDNVFAVGTTDMDDYKMFKSNYGSGLDIAAPGENILGIIPDYPEPPYNSATYEMIPEGLTSAASAMVSATIGLMLSVNPDLTNEEIRDILHESADKVHENDPNDPYVYDYFGFNQYVGYGRLNTYKAVCMAWEYIEFDEEIVSITTWSEPKSFINPVIVNSGAKLIITSEIQFGPEAVLIIEPGAELEIDGGLLTNLKCCGYDNVLWPGVEVWGDKNYSQFKCDGQQQQGKIRILNSGTIENAEIGVLLAARNGESYNQTGGIIEVPDNGDRYNPSAYFTNNRKSVVFWTYRNFYPDLTEDPLTCTLRINYAPNVSYLKNCHFEMNGDYIAGGWWYSNIYMLGVNGVNIEGCTFINNKSETPAGHGINAWGSGFKVEAICRSHQSPCPEEYLDLNKFTNFTKAINLNSAGTYTITVDNAEFYDNTYGVKLKLVNNATILFSDFYIGENADEPGQCEGEGKEEGSYGIHLEYCTGFAIEENKFYKATGAPLGNYIGIHIAETQATDEVYKNYFDGLSYGNYAVGKNWYWNHTWEGLAYYCNENTGNWEDFTVEDVPNQDDGIQDPIGSVEMPAGNTFSANANYNFNNWDYNDWIGYYYYAPTQGNTNTVYYPDEVNRITREEVVGIQNECTSHYGGGGSGGSGRGMVLSPEEKQQAEQEFVTNLTGYNNVKALYDNLKDGGNTEATIAEVETAWPDDTWELRAELLGKSPHLSMDVLKAAADKTEVLPESIIFEIMAANPDELKKEELIKYLEDKENPLPGYMIDILRQVSTGTTYKTVLHRQMAHYNQLKTRAAHDIIRSILNDTITDYVELRNWLDNIGGKRTDEQIIASYMQEGNTLNAMSLVNMMPTLYAYKDDEITEHNYYTEMLNLQITLANEGRTIFDLNSIEVNNLVLIAENSNGTAGTQAKGILEFAYGYHYCDCINADTSGYKSSSSFNPNAFEKMYNIEIAVEPNPAKDWAAFNYILPNSGSEAVIKISDVSGKLVAAFTITGKQGQKIWDTRKIKSGVYFYTLNISGFNKSGKLVISK